MGTNAVQLLNNGKIVLGGTYYYSNYSQSGFTLVKVNANGTLDASFGNSGFKNFNFGGQNDYLYGILVQADGKILAAGSSAGKFALARINTNAGYDANFNITGKTLTEFDAGSTSRANYISFEPDQKILATGLISRNDSTVGFCTARFHTGNTVGLMERQDLLQTWVYPNPFTQSFTLDVALT